MQSAKSALSRGTVLVVSPHPDDESIGAPATLLQLRDAGYRIINVAVSLGLPHRHADRRHDLEAACERLGFELIVPAEPVRMSVSANDDLAKAEASAHLLIAELLRRYKPAVVVSPNIHDAHPAHEVVARAVKEAISASKSSRVWWMYSIWGDLPLQTIYVPFDDAMLRRIKRALTIYKIETDRNDFRRMVEGRGMLNAVLGSERVFGTGSAAASPMPYAELLMEVIYDGVWREGEKRILDPHEPFCKPTKIPMDWWIHAPSPNHLYRGYAVQSANDSRS